MTQVRGNQSRQEVYAEIERLVKFSTMTVTLRTPNLF